MVNYEKQARIFKVLSVDTRIRMLELLKGGPLCVNALSKRLGITPSAVSQNLRILRDADLVVADKQGYFVHYGINRQTMTELRSLANGVFSMPNLL
ncbi:metalloregulator ArsR/SmtB family transcription factor [Pseudodesulfovibrio thermohalotolerans]|jgi:DNA-binding transcriptional ArsR family regulator|uniref:Transcriptional repressor SdpR n=1 Tax=Pseudodesulfovibrio hydrargyri TaxID=2125990 RepID=A0A1J5MVH2_9BACT|nr:MULTISPECIES: metalloregulator ArsR/SmtB family transcription factor [Pseudodesulfovibrio]OIQ49946.1 Transcriptional repressor SdpR [Pseudodesulfovibrio hydrargyri]WFS62630.1 metalloregulator ArsR/SmtB family transcription factor [Pseudodesulfovibrio thermohalotolerans]